MPTKPQQAEIPVRSLACTAVHTWQILTLALANLVAGLRLVHGCSHTLGAWVILVLAYQDIVGELHHSVVDYQQFNALPLKEICQESPSVRARLAMENHTLLEAFFVALESDDLKELDAAIKSSTDDFFKEKRLVFEKEYERLSESEKQISMFYS